MRATMELVARPASLTSQRKARGSRGMDQLARALGLAPRVGRTEDLEPADAEVPADSGNAFAMIGHDGVHAFQCIDRGEGHATHAHSASAHTSRS